MLDDKDTLQSLDFNQERIFGCEVLNKQGLKFVCVPSKKWAANLG